MERSVFYTPPENTVEEADHATELIRKMTAGEELWWPGMDTDSGRTAYLFANRKCLGYISHEYDTDITDIVLYPEDANGEPRTISSEIMTEEAAAEVLRTAAGLKVTDQE